MTVFLLTSRQVCFIPLWHLLCPVMAEKKVESALSPFSRDLPFTSSALSAVGLAHRTSTPWDALCGMIRGSQSNLKSKLVLRLQKLAGLSFTGSLHCLIVRRFELGHGVVEYCVIIAASFGDACLGILPPGKKWNQVAMTLAKSFLHEHLLHMSDT